MREFQILELISKTASKNEKLKILASCNTEEMKKILYLTMNKFLTYRVKQVDMPKTFNSLQPNVIPELEQLLLGLAKHDKGSNEAKAMIKRLLSKCTPEGAAWVLRIIQRDLNIGCDEKSVNRVFPGLIPIFSVQLALPLENWDKVSFPVVVEEKLDGVRCIAVVKDGEVSYFSREGRQFQDLPAITEEILGLFPGKSVILDGEIIGHVFNPKNKTSQKNANGNWPFAQSLSMLKSQDTTAEDIKSYLAYFCWDVISPDYFLTQGIMKEKGNSLLERKFELTALFERNKITRSNLFMVPNVVCHTKEEVLSIFDQIRSKNGEGVMVKNPNAPYSFKRNDNILKLKEFFTFDLRVESCAEGAKDSKYEGMLGAITFVDDTGTIKSDVGSGFSDNDRYELWLRWLNGTLKGTIHEIMFQEVTEDGSLRFPTYVRERTDKTVTSIS